MNTNTAAADTAQIRRVSATSWTVAYTRRFINRRLVAQGGDPYEDVEMSCQSYKTRKAAERAIEAALAAGYTVNRAGGLVIDQRNR